MEFVKSSLFIRPEKIVIVGRSIGTGPACHLAAKYNIAGLVLISPFTSIKEVVSDMVGSIGSMFVKDRFNNLDKFSKLTSPVMLIHGAKDSLISPKHSEKLYGIQTSNLDACPTICQLLMPSEMTHSDMSYQVHLFDPIKHFLDKVNFRQSNFTSVYFASWLYKS